MTFQPVVGQELEIDKIIYRVAEHPAAPGIPYGQEGRQAVVYKLLCEEGDKAFKVFKSRFRTPAMVTHADQIERYSSMKGLRVCRRTVLTSRRHTELLRQYSNLTYAVLMPWVEGPTWQEIILEKRKLTPQQSLLIVRAVGEVLVSMEERGIAHCDLSGANLILNPDLRSTELVDVEGIYSSDLPRPKILPAGSPGYAHETAPKGLWDPDADRFAGAVLLSEVLGWCDEVVREKAWGESYFNPRLIQQDNESYKLFFNSLQRQWGKELSQLFARAWNSDTLAECPTFGEWWVALPTEVPEIGVREKTVVSPVEVEEEPEPEPEPVPLAPEPELLCPHCGNMVPGGMDTCPHCERGIDEPVEETERQRRIIPVWGWMVIGVVVIGLVIVGVIFGMRGEGLLAYLATNTPVPFSTRKKLPTPTLGVGSTMLSEMDGMLMVYVPAGEFEMGANANQGYEICMEYHSDCKMSWFEHEEPNHEVYLDAFWVYQTEVTNEMYEQCVQAGGCGFPNDTEFFDDNYYANHPVVAVTWYDAEDYCDWAEKRLPTEAEWEKAARGEDGRVYPWGNVFDGRLVNFCDINCPIYDADEKFDDGYAQWSPVGFYLYGVSPYGALDMAGNVDEWVADWYDENYYAISSYKNPQGPSSGNDKVLRGGAWYEYPWNVRAASRYGVAPESNDPYKGFRCVFSP